MIYLKARRGKAGTGRDPNGQSPSKQRSSVDGVLTDSPRDKNLTIKGAKPGTPVPGQKVGQSGQLFACWVNLHSFLSSADFFNINNLKKKFQEYHRVSNSMGPDKAWF